MESHEVLKKAMDNLGVKSVASKLNLSTSLVYKWCQPSESPNDSGAENPLDRLDRICQRSHYLYTQSYYDHYRRRGGTD